MFQAHLGNAIETAQSKVRIDSTARACGLDEVLARILDKELRPTAEAALWLEDELLELTVAGHETTAATAAWTLKYLSDNPGVQSTLREALRTAFSDDVATPALPDPAHILAADIPYLDAVIAEVSRISNPGPVSFRETTQDTTILGCAVPAHTNVILIPGGPSHKRLHPLGVDEHNRDVSSQKASSQFPSWQSRQDLNEFKPERWLTTDLDSQAIVFNSRAGPSLPFSTGSRGCFGKKIALMELRILIVLLMLQFDFREVKGRLAGYEARDGLSRSPRKCYVKLA